MSCRDGTSRNEDSSEEGSSASVGRREYLKLGASLGVAAAAGVGGVAGIAGAAAACSRSSYEIRAGTDEETTVYVVEAPEPGPTVMVTGGVHGNEPSGYRAADRIKDWRIDRGKLVVVPEANRKGIENGTRGYDDAEKGYVDLNRQFPAGSEPETELARELWDAVVNEGADFLWDLHGSVGLYENGDGDGVGQGIFSTDAGDAGSHHAAIRDYLNGNLVENPDHEFTGYNHHDDGSSPMLKHKVGADLDTGAIIFETYRGIELSRQVEFATAAVRRYLYDEGLLDANEVMVGGHLSYNGDAVAVDTPEDSHDESSGLRFSVTNDSGGDLTITDLDIEPESAAVDQLRDHSYSEGEWVSELSIDADVQDGLTDVNYGLSLPGSIDLDADGHSAGAQRNAVLSAGSEATVSLYQFKSDGAPKHMVGESVAFTVRYELADGTGGSESFTVTGGGVDLDYDRDATAVDAPVDSNGKRSGLKFGVTNRADANLSITRVAVDPANAAIDGLADHSYSEGEWVSELSIDADVQDSTTDVNYGLSLPGTIDLKNDGHSESDHRRAVLSPGSSASVSLYQFESGGSAVDMVGESVDVTVDYTVDDGNGTTGSETFTLRP